VQLRSIAHVRSGDKGGTSDLTVVARDDAAYVLLVEHLTPDAVQAYFADLPVTRVERHELPQLRALKFVMDGALGGGVTTSLALDAHGKCLSSCLLAMDVGARHSSHQGMSRHDIDLGRGGDRP
jgi:hypothetical protein